jgi:hypothetical protein
LSHHNVGQSAVQLVDFTHNPMVKSNAEK